MVITSLPTAAAPVPDQDWQTIRQASAELAAQRQNANALKLLAVAVMPPQINEGQPAPLSTTLGDIFGAVPTAIDLPRLETAIASVHLWLARFESDYGNMARLNVVAAMIDPQERPLALIAQEERTKAAEPPTSGVDFAGFAASLWRRGENAV